MRRILAVAIGVMTIAGCGPRRVEVETGPATSGEVSLRVTNNLSQAVNIYIAGGTGTSTAGSEVFVKQIAANTSEWVPVRGYSEGASVTLRARTVDGARTYSRDNVVLQNMYEWRVP